MPQAATEPARRGAAPRAASEGDRDATRPRCRVRGVKKSFGATPVLRGVDLAIDEGAFAVLVGPSGCGKTTLLRLVAGLEIADEGAVFLGDRDVTALPPRDRDVAMVFQSYALYPHLTVRENLAFGLRMRGTEPREIDARIKEASSMLGLDALLARLPKQLSGGQRQRVAMGRAVVRRPQMFLFDEPLSNLDAALRAEVRIEIRRLHERLGATTLYVTHDQVEAMTLADTLWVLNGGVVEQRGAPLDVYARPRSKFVATFLGSPQMNLVDATLMREGGRWLADGGGLHVEVDEDRFGAALAEGRAVIVGARPHDLAASDPGSAAMKLHVEIVEALGFEAFAYGHLSRGARDRAAPGDAKAGPRVIARLAADDAQRARAGEELPLGIAKAHVHLFDPTTGAALDAG